MEEHANQRVPHQSGAFGHGGVGMQVTKDAFLGIHPPCDLGNYEAGPISGHGGIGNVLRLDAEIDLGKFDGVHN
jgi:hypothetical protein